MRMEFFVDPASGWAWWTPDSPVEDRPRSAEQRTGARWRPAGRGLVVRLLGRVGAWFGVCELTAAGAWRRVHVRRRDPGEPGAQGRHSTIWSWWCP